jgi:hypothetical protein
VTQFEQRRDEDEDVRIMGISLRHDEHTPAMILLWLLLLFMLLVSFIVGIFALLTRTGDEREREKERGA